MHWSHIDLFLPVVMRSLPHSLSSLECEEGKQYHEKMQFAHSIIQNIYRSRSPVVNFCKDEKEVGVQRSKEAQEHNNGSNTNPKI